MKKAKVVCLLGIDGSGKTTIIRKLEEYYKDKGLKCKSIYFGWMPFLPLTKFISFLFKKKDYRIVKELNKKKVSKRKISFLKGIFLLYYYFEYLFRYFFKIMIKSFFFDVFLVDRYFYDVYAHYDLGKSKLFRVLVKIFPKPHYIFLLDVDVKTAKRRKKEIDIKEVSKHRRRYEELGKILKFDRIDTNKKISGSLEEIIKKIKV